ncbi:MAG: DNA (cytosine-5-)-methyltransferase [Dehalococcoidia bacterium]|jgi:site-specific DNA-cytosine methylase
MNVLSLFDGMSCGQLALRKTNIKYDNYFASEIEKDSITVATANFPGTIQLGDVTKITASMLPQIDLLIGGSPCQGFSNSGDGLNFSDPRSKLFFEFVRLLKELKPKYFLLENVVMKKEWAAVITKYLGVDYIKINSSLFVPQNRPRLYWTNIPLNIALHMEMDGIEPHGKTLKDILLPDGDERLKPFMLSEKAKGYMSRDRQPGKPRWEYHTNPLSGNAACLTANMYKGVPYGVIKEKMRRLHPIECERLQGVPDDYTSMVSNTSRYKMLGNGWTVDTIAYIMSFMEL